MTSQPLSKLPDTCDVAFKEWQGVCEALARGDQSLILRKGGIGDEGDRFVADHDAFWLYPTVVHQAEQGLRSAQPQPWVAPVAPGQIRLNLFVTVDRIIRCDDLAQLQALEGLHVWTRETVARRFHYRTPGIWVLGVRVFRTHKPWLLPIYPEHEGCKTWVPLEPALPTDGLEPALDLERFRVQMDNLSDILQPTRRP